ncbi:uncharacterized protein LOC110940675 isoform X2 [Helianthus annuus]|uniref:uncharacterized protein LOC110940675 isoform X2 n=1 Tax=Helianthus annuus TaxID=4232 RepID=UPI001652DBAD|nr:uncharacterized protein LOC110940675 isoform X2 [Helianthus annuus]
MLTLIDWIRKNISSEDSSGSTAGLLHRDFRMDNLVFHPIEGRQWPVAGWKFYIAFSLFRGASILAGVAVDISWVMHQVESALKMQGKKPMVLYKLRGLIYKGKMFCHNPPSGYHIPIFEKGYEKDPAIVAKEAIQEATRNGSDVVLSGSHAGQ